MAGIDVAIDKHTYNRDVMFRIHLFGQIILSISLYIAFVAREPTENFLTFQLIRETLAPATPFFCDFLFKQNIKNRIFSHDALILLQCF